MPTPKNHATGLSDLLIPKNVESSEELQKKLKKLIRKKIKTLLYTNNLAWDKDASVLKVIP
jgi:hypothetical protein